MGKLDIRYDRSTGLFRHTAENLWDEYVDVSAGLAEPMEFDGLEFGFVVVHESGEVVARAAFPPPGVEYLRTDQPILETKQVFMSRGERYAISMWLTNGGYRCEGSIGLTIPKPPQPHKGWVWNGRYWEAPVPYPMDGNAYRWVDGQGWAVMVYE